MHFCWPNKRFFLAQIEFEDPVLVVVVVVVRHPDILSGMAIATKDTLGCESFLSSKEIVQFLFEQSIE